MCINQKAQTGYRCGIVMRCFEKGSEKTLAKLFGVHNKGQFVSQNKVGFQYEKTLKKDMLEDS